MSGFIVRQPNGAAASRLAAFLMALAVHGALLGVIVWLGARGSRRTVANVVAPISPARGVTDGPGILMLALPDGPSLTSADAEPLLGRYTALSEGPDGLDVRVALVSDAEGNGTLAISEAGAAPNSLILVAPDSFVARLNPQYRVTFIRRAGVVTAVELGWPGSVRRAVKLAAVAQQQ